MRFDCALAQRAAFARAARADRAEAEGMSNQTIDERCGLSVPTINHWRRRGRECGVAGPHGETASGASAHLRPIANGGAGAQIAPQQADERNQLDCAQCGEGNRVNSNRSHFLSVLCKIAAGHNAAQATCFSSLPGRGPERAAQPGARAG